MRKFILGISEALVTTELTRSRDSFVYHMDFFLEWLAEI